MNVTDFFDKYELVRDITVETLLKTKPEKLYCRFCKRTDEKTLFKSIAHIVPELLGQNSYICFDECDECNRLFSKYENHLAIFIRPYLSVMGIDTKNGVPAFQSRSDGNERMRTRFSTNKDGTKSLIIGDLNDIRADETGHTFSIRFRMPPYRQSDMFRSLLKIGLSLMPEQYLNSYQNSINWLLNKPATVNRIQGVIVTVLTTSKFVSPNVFLYKKREPFSARTEMPDFTLIIGTANLMLQIFLPYSDDLNDIPDINKKPEATVFPTIAYEKHISETRARTFYKDLLEDQTIEEEEWITFTSPTPLQIAKLAYEQNI